MSYFKIQGSKELSGEINVSGAKNAALKIIPAALLGNSPSVIRNVPKIVDIEKMIEILRSIGAEITFENGTVSIDPKNVNRSHPDEKLMKKLRGAVVLIGVLLSKFNNAIFSQPGGCLIGARPIDDHIDVFEQLKVNVLLEDDKYIINGRPQAGKIVLKKMSVTATENAILASVLSPGITTIHCAAAEPEILDLANFLNKMGAKIKNAGTHDITIEGVSKLQGVEYEVIPDRIEAGTFIITGIATNSEITVGPLVSDHLNIVLKKLNDIGANFEVFKKDGKEYVKTYKHERLVAQDIDTRTYPGFPTDLQSFYTVLMTQAEGTSNIFETIFEGRFASIEELQLLRAKTQILNPHEFTVEGKTKLIGTKISSKDIRGGASLVIAALLAQGETLIEDIEYIDRGYERIDEKLNSIGAQIERVN